MTPQEVLIKASELLESRPTAWTQRRIARDDRGWPEAANHPSACSWCEMGAVQAVTPVKHELKAFGALNEAARHLYNGISIPEVNDELGHAAVLACFDQAIKDA